MPESEDRDRVNELREALADYAHDAWSGWMKYMFSRCEKRYLDHAGYMGLDVDGHPAAHAGYMGMLTVIPPQLVERWTFQMNTPYAELPEEMKPSDRVQAEKIIDVILKYSNRTLLEEAPSDG